MEKYVGYSTMLHYHYRTKKCILFGIQPLSQKKLQPTQTCVSFLKKTKQKHKPFLLSLIVTDVKWEGFMAMVHKWRTMNSVLKSILSHLYLGPKDQAQVSNCAWQVLFPTEPLYCFPHTLYRIWGK